MRVPLQWLDDYVKTTASPEEIAEVLTLSGSEVEKIEKQGDELSEVLVGQIETIDPHPNADRLQLAVVKIGTDKKTSVVCGASNIEIGQKVPIALPGTTLPNGMKLEVTKIRGEESKGMLCAEDELGLGEDHSGILILDPRTPVGIPLPKALGFSKAVLSIDVTPNRSDCFSVEGLAREYAAVTKKKMSEPKMATLPQKKKKDITVSIKSKKECSQYYALKIDGITNGPSPIWMQTRLREAGVRPINAVVDITNYVMLATGQPMHAFDAEKLNDKSGKITIQVRHATKDEELEALDGTTYTLDTKMMVIASHKGPIAIAGVMGGEPTGVTNNTTSIIFEAATFDSVSVRKTAQTLALRSESSSRFEKGVYPEGTTKAIRLALALTKKLVGGSVTEFVHVASSKPTKPKEIFISYEHIERIVGISIPKTTIKTLLTSIGFTIKEATKNTAKVTVPEWRLDVSLEEDVIEEIVRVYGVNNLKPARMHMAVKAPQVHRGRPLEMKIKDTLVAHGFTEIYLYSFYGDRDRRLDCLSMFCDGRYDHLTVTKPLNPEQQYVRKSLLPGIVKTFSKNINLFPDEEIKLFEVGKTFIPQKNDLPKEQLIAAGGVSFMKKNTEHALLFTKGVVESALHEAGIREPLTLSGLYERGVAFELNGKTIGMVYVPTDQELANYKLKKPVALFEISLSAIEVYSNSKTAYIPHSQYPAVTRDLAIEVDSSVLWGDVEKVVTAPTLESVRFMSHYPLGDKKSLAFRMVFRSQERTLEAKEVEKAIEKITALLEKRFNATIRGA